MMLTCGAGAARLCLQGSRGLSGMRIPPGDAFHVAVVAEGAGANTCLSGTRPTGTARSLITQAHAGSGRRLTAARQSPAATPIASHVGHVRAFPFTIPSSPSRGFAAAATASESFAAGGRAAVKARKGGGTAVDTAKVGEGHQHIRRRRMGSSSNTRVCDWLEPGGAKQKIATRGVSTEAEVEVAFHRVADEMLGNLEDVVEAWGEDNDVEDFDFSHEEGVVTIQMGTHGTYVINKQGPNRQVWVSSPVGGPLRYDYDAARKVWVYARDGHCLHDRLQDELTGMGGGTLDLGTLNE
mmetsp:Transcript_7619/g.11972  ORF Transcript_7619/g.11972 Transcript_7619/m.11972 type:complete len:296 (+) Transcript_7619:86-973(+)